MKLRSACEMRVWARPTAPTSTTSRSRSTRCATATWSRSAARSSSSSRAATSRRDYHEEIYRLTIVDGLTQIFNKRYFLEHLEREIGALPALPAAAVADDVRHRPLQEDQRHLRPPRRRLRAASELAGRHHRAHPQGGPRFSRAGPDVLGRHPDVPPARDALPGPRRARAPGRTRRSSRSWSWTTVPATTRPRLLAAYRPAYPFRFFSQENAGPAAARNRGVREARGAMVLFLGDDTVPEPAAARPFTGAPTPSRGPIRSPCSATRPGRGSCACRRFSTTSTSTGSSSATA